MANRLTYSMCSIVMNKGKQNLIETYTNTRRTMYVNNKKIPALFINRRTSNPVSFL